VKDGMRFYRRALAWAAWFPLGAALAAADSSGRWEGTVEIPGAPMRVVVDLAPDGRGDWSGSIVLPGRGVKGAPLDALRVTDAAISFGCRSAFAFPIEPEPAMTLARDADGTLDGTFVLGGHSAAVRLHRTGAPQVDRAETTATISATLEGTWTGRYELGGYPRDVTVTLANRPPGAAGGQFVILGKRTSKLEIDQIVEGREYVTLRASAADFRIEGRFDADSGTIDGAMSQGPFEAPIVLKRQASGGGKAS
jgi:hypothetical protein